MNGKDSDIHRIDMADRYLGDGVYASFDGYHIYLDLRGQDARSRIALEPQTFDALIQYKADVQAAIASAAEGGGG